MGTCKKCGNIFTPRRSGRPQLFCCRACKVKWSNDYFNARQPRATDRRLGTIARTISFSDLQKEIIYGTLLGDSSLIEVKSGGGGKYRLSMTQGTTQLPYLQWKRDSLAFVFHKETPILCRNKTKGSEFYIIGSVFHPYFAEMRQLFYPNGTKIMPRKIIETISPLTLAVWYMDDGSWNPNPKSQQAVISTDSFGKEEVKFASDVIFERYSIKSSVYLINTMGTYGGGLYTRLVFLRSTINKFLDLIGPYIHPSMSYKIR